MRSALMTYRAAGISLAVLTLVAACSAPAAPAAATPGSTPAAVVTTAAATPTAAPTAPARAARPAFLSHTFTDVRDGKTFTLSDFSGRQVLVIGMAVW